MAASLAELEVLINLQTIGEGKLAALNSSLGGLATWAGIAAVGVGALYEYGKSALQNYESQTRALNDLNQAYNATGQSLSDNQDEIAAWLEKNKAFIDNQYDAEEAIASFIRAGVSQKTTMDLMNDAENLAALKHISLADAAKILLMATEGNTRGLRDLGFTSKEITAIEKDLQTSQERGAAINDLVAGKVKGGTNALTDMDKAHNKMTKDWQDFSAQSGPAVEKAFEAIFEALDNGIGILEVFGDFLPKLAAIEYQWAHDAVATFQGWEVAAVQSVNNVISALNHIPGIHLAPIVVSVVGNPFGDTAAVPTQRQQGRGAFRNLTGT